MTTPIPQQGTPPFDPGNQLLAGGPAQLTVDEVLTPQGKAATLTIRTASTTLTVFLSREDLAAWAQSMQQRADAMSGLLLVGAGAMPPAAGVGAVR
jgi:hypothetical protein